MLWQPPHFLSHRKRPEEHLRSPGPQIKFRIPDSEFPYSAGSSLAQCAHLVAPRGISLRQ